MLKYQQMLAFLTFISMINTTSDRLKVRSLFSCRFFIIFEKLKFHSQLSWAWQGPKVITFSCSTQVSTKFILLIDVKMPTNVGILTFMSMINTTSDRSFFSCRYFIFYEQLKFHSQLSWVWKKLYNLGARPIFHITFVMKWITVMICVKHYAWHFSQYTKICKVSWKWNPRKMAKSLCRLLIKVNHALVANF